MIRVVNIVLAVFAIVLTAAIVLSGNTKNPSSRILAGTGAESKRALVNVINDVGATNAWRILKEAYLTDGQLQHRNIDPHTLAHQIGRAIYKERGINGLSICDDAFTGGCFHGVVEEVLILDGVGASARIGRLCSTLDNPSGCAHGAGHGLNEASERNLSNAMRSCATFPESLKPDCIEGLLMDNLWSWKEADVRRKLWAICEGLSPEYHVACASSLGNYFSEHKSVDVHSYEPSTIAAVCGTAPTEEMSNRCLLRLGQSITRRTNGHVEQIILECGRLFTDQQDDCLKNAVSFAISAKYIDPSISRLDICARYFGEKTQHCPI